MAVKTFFTDHDFHSIVSGYDLGTYKASRPLNTGAVQTNILLETSKGSYAFKYYENRSDKYVRFETELLDFLTRHTYGCPAPIKNNQGDAVGHYADKPYALFSFLEGEPSNSTHYGLQVAQAIGILHQLTHDYKPSYAHHRDSYDPMSCRRNARANKVKISSKSEAKSRLEWLEYELGKLDLPATLPKGVCHCDTHPSNFLYQNDKLVAVLDFDDAAYIYLLYDLANLLFFWAWPDRDDLDFDTAKRLIAEYQRYRPLTQEEQEHLFDMLHMVNFMGVGWFIDHERDVANSRRKTEFLNALGRKRFYNKLFL
jgi:homoserine kinase type II